MIESNQSPAALDQLFAGVTPEPRHYAAAEALRNLPEINEDSVAAVLSEFLQPAEPELEP